MGKRVGLLIAGASLSLAVSAGPRVAELVTPPLPATTTQGSTNFSECVVLNVSDRVLDIVIHGLNSEGAVVASSTPSVPPLVTRGFSVSEAAGVMACRFTFRGRASSVRAAIHVLQPGVGIISALEARAQGDDRID